MRNFFKILLVLCCFNIVSYINAEAKEISLIEKAEKTKDAEDFYKLGKAYFYGTDGLTQDYTQAFRWLYKASDENYVKADNLLGEMYENGLGVEKDYARAVSYYSKTSDKKDPLGMTKMGIYYFTQHSYVDALPLLKAAHKKKQSEATSYLGLMYIQGKGVPKNVKRGIGLILKAANSGNVNAQYLMGSLYFQRNYGLINYNKAKIWFNKAARKGDERAQYNLAQIYYYGKGCKINYPMAFRWYLKSAEQGNKDSQYRVALMYIKGRGVNKSDEEAYKWCQKSVEQGNRKAKQLLEALNLKRRY